MQREQQAALLDAWGDCRVLGSLAGGYRNQVLLVECEGNRYVAKVSRRSTEAITWLEPVQDMARRAGFVVPHFLRSKSGELRVNGLTLETWIEGTMPSGHDLARLEGLLTSFHSLTASWRQRPGFASTLELLTLERGGDVDLSVMPGRLVETCRSAWLEVSQDPVSAVHGDVNQANLLLTPDGRLALLDWDEARVDAPTLDHAAMAQATGQAQPRQHRAQRALLAWEVASSWVAEPDYAKRLARELMSAQGERRKQ